MSKRSGLYPRVRVDAAGKGVVSHAGGSLLTATVQTSGLDVGLSAAWAPWRKPLAIHDPAKVILDLAVAVGLGGDCLADIGLLRAEPAVFAQVASDPTVSGTIDVLAADALAALRAIHAARAAARAHVGDLAGQDAPPAGVDAAHPIVIDVDATLVTAHSDKEGAAATFQRGWGHHPLWAFVDHGPAGTGAPLAVLLRPGNAGSTTAADHLVIREAWRQLPFPPTGRLGRRVLVRLDGAGATHNVVNYLHARRMGYSIGCTLPEYTPDLLKLIPDSAWTPAYDADGKVRPSAWVAELTGLLDLTGNAWPADMRVIVRKERPHPGAQLRITDVDGHRITAFATNIPTGGPGTGLPERELRHRRRARAEDRIRAAKDTGLANLPLHDLDQNRIWCAIIALALNRPGWRRGS